MDKRIRHIDRTRDRELREQLYKQVAAGDISLGKAVATMRRISHLTQPEFAAHRGISVEALRKLEAGKGNPTVETLNKVARIFGLQVGFVPIRGPQEP